MGGLHGEGKGRPIRGFYAGLPAALPSLPVPAQERVAPGGGSACRPAEAEATSNRQGNRSGGRDPQGGVLGNPV